MAGEFATLELAVKQDVANVYGKVSDFFTNSNTGVQKASWFSTLKTWQKILLIIAIIIVVMIIIGLLLGE